MGGEIWRVIDGVPPIPVHHPSTTTVRGLLGLGWMDGWTCVCVSVCVVGAWDDGICIQCATYSKYLG